MKIDLTYMFQFLNNLNKKTFNNAVDDYVSFEFFKNTLNILYLDMYKIFKIENNINTKFNKDFIIKKSSLIGLRKGKNKYYLTNIDDNFIYISEIGPNINNLYKINKIYRSYKYLDFLKIFKYNNNYNINGYTLKNNLKKMKNNITFFSEDQSLSIFIKMQDMDAVKMDAKYFFEYNTLSSDKSSIKVDGFDVYNMLNCLPISEKNNTVTLKFNENGVYSSLHMKKNNHLVTILKKKGE